MAEQKIRLYFDENMPEAVATQLASLGIDVLTTQKAERGGTGDLAQLRFATSLGRVICSQDKDFLILARTHPVHCGIVFVQHKSQKFGTMHKALRELHKKETAESMNNSLRFV